MKKEIELINLEIDINKQKITNTAIGLSALGGIVFTFVLVMYNLQKLFNTSESSLKIMLLFSIIIIIIAALFMLAYLGRTNKTLDSLYRQKQNLIKESKEE